MKPQTISKAALERATLAACKVTHDAPPPKWFREHTKAKVVAALTALQITIKDPRPFEPPSPSYADELDENPAS